MKTRKPPNVNKSSNKTVRCKLSKADRLVYDAVIAVEIITMLALMVAAVLLKKKIDLSNENVLAVNYAASTILCPIPILILFIVTIIPVLHKREQGNPLFKKTVYRSGYEKLRHDSAKNTVRRFLVPVIAAAVLILLAAVFPRTCLTTDYEIISFSSLNTCSVKAQKSDIKSVKLRMVPHTYREKAVLVQLNLKNRSSIIFYSFNFKDISSMLDFLETQTISSAPCRFNFKILNFDDMQLERFYNICDSARERN